MSYLCGYFNIIYRKIIDFNALIWYNIVIDANNVIHSVFKRCFFI